MNLQDVFALLTRGRQKVAYDADETKPSARAHNIGLSQKPKTPSNSKTLKACLESARAKCTVLIAKLAEAWVWTALVSFLNS